MFNLENAIMNSVKNLPDYNHMLGRGLMQPFKPSNSGSRALMHSIHAEQLLVLNNAEVPAVSTGYETKFGEVSTSYVAAESNYRVVAKINRFDNSPNHYYLIIEDLITGVYDMIERTPYCHNTEGYGYLYDNSKLDRVRANDIINRGSIVKTSIGYDEFGNKSNGVNLLTVYMSLDANMEDSVIISETAAKKLAATNIFTVDIPINDNDILLNLYGDYDSYKTFPDIGEEIKDGIFCSIRRMENSTALYTMSKQRLRETMISDRNILMEGTVVDIDVKCNNQELISNSMYNSQLYYYHQQHIRMCNEFVNIVGPIAMNHELSYELNAMYSRCRDVVGGKQYYKEKVFNNAILTITVASPLAMAAGDKMCDRYGGKGVVSYIVPDELMPILDNGKRVEVIKNQSTCMNRENIGQLHELSLNFISARIIDYFKKCLSANNYCYTDMAKMWAKYLYIVDPIYADNMVGAYDIEDDFQASIIIEDIISEDRIYICDQPFTTRINIDTIAEIYKEFPWIKQYRIKVPMEDSNGNIRYVKANRPVVCGEIYHYRLKQYAEEKFSVTSLSATNLKNLNTRSKANKMYESKYTKTPIMFGFMEAGNLLHIGAQNVVMALMLYSSSPQARRLTEQLLTGDPYDINIVLDKDSKNRNAEIINALMSTMGVQLVFKKTPKVPNYMCRKIMCTREMCKIVDNTKPRNMCRIVDKGKEDENVKCDTTEVIE